MVFNSHPSLRWKRPSDSNQNVTQPLVSFFERNVFINRQQLEQIRASEPITRELTRDRLGGIKHSKIAADFLAFRPLERFFGSSQSLS